MNRFRSLSFLLLALFVLASCGKTESSLSSPEGSSPAASLPEKSTPSSSSAAPTEVLENRNLKWTDSAKSKVSLWRESDPDFLAVDSIRYVLKGTSAVTNAEIKLSSSNPDVIPDEALSHQESTMKKSNVITGGIVQLDLTKVHLGTTYITLDFRSTAGSSARGTIVKKIEVVPFGEVPCTHYSQTVTVDYSYVKDSLWNSLADKGKISYSFNAPYGSDIFDQRNKAVDIDKTKKQVSLTFEAIPNVKVYLSVYYLKDEEGHVQFIAMDQPTSSVEKKNGYTITQDTFGQAANLTFGEATITSPITVYALNQTA
jgi:hypothetical protein